jgi:hypothetical protein
MPSWLSQGAPSAAGGTQTLLLEEIALAWHRPPPSQTVFLPTASAIGPHGSPAPLTGTAWQVPSVLDPVATQTRPIEKLQSGSVTV